MTTIEASVPGGLPATGASELAVPVRRGRTAATLVVRTWGHPAAPVVLLLPAADDLYGWGPAFVDRLVGAGLRVATFLADVAPADGGEAVVDAIATLNALRVDAAHVVGASAGGLVAQALAGRSPERLRSLTLLMTRRPGPRYEGAVADPTAMLGGSGASESLAGFAADPAFLASPLPPEGLPVTVVHGAHDGVVSRAAADDLVAALKADLVVLDAGHELPHGHEGQVAAIVARQAGLTLLAPPVKDRRKLVPYIGLAILALLVASVVSAASLPLPYYVIRPGSARQVNDLVTVPADKRHEPKGRVLFVTVGLQQLHGLTYLEAKRDDEVQVVSEEAIFGKQDRSQYNQQAKADMVQSKESAAIVAARRLCLPIQVTNLGAFIEQVAQGSPAAQAGIVQGDTIVAVDHQPVGTVDEAGNKIRAHKPGEQVVVSVQGPKTGDASREVTVTPGANKDGQAVIGVSLLTRTDTKLPFDITINTAAVGGPSAGLAFTLAILDELTDGELTGGNKVAATGSIDDDGNVGPIGGEPQKAVAVRRAKAALFLVPSPELFEDPGQRAGAEKELAEVTKRVGPATKVVKVKTIDDALDALRTVGGNVDSLPHIPCQ